MKLTNLGAARRPKLIPACGRPPRAAMAERIPNLSEHELRRIVAAMIG